MSQYTSSQAYPWALTGVFAALHFVMTIFPFAPSIGGGGVISIGLISAPIIGYILGERYGTLAVLIGSILGIFANPAVAIIGLFTPLAPTASAFAAGVLRTKYAFTVPILFVVAFFVYLVGPIGLLLPGYLWLHSVAFVISIIIALPFVAKMFRRGVNFTETDPFASAMFIGLLSFISVMLDHIVGSSIGVYYFNYVFSLDALTLTEIFKFVTVIYPIERLIAASLATMMIFVVGAIIIESNLYTPGGTQELLELDISDIDDTPSIDN
ncbi:MAG: hypothetical protein ACXAAP_08225 [Candidatus Thorarchaeota archaeon]|jgi:hypothetical protein